MAVVARALLDHVQVDPPDLAIWAWGWRVFGTQYMAKESEQFKLSERTEVFGRRLRRCSATVVYSIHSPVTDLKKARNPPRDRQPEYESCSLPTMFSAAELCWPSLGMRIQATR